MYVAWPISSFRSTLKPILANVNASRSRNAAPSCLVNPTKKGPTEIEKVERRITTLEQHVAELEAKLAEDWTNMDTLTEYRTSRDELQELLARWEALFETA